MIDKIAKSMNVPQEILEEVLFSGIKLPEDKRDVLFVVNEVEPHSNEEFECCYAAKFVRKLLPSYVGFNIKDESLLFKGFETVDAKLGTALLNSYLYRQEENIRNASKIYINGLRLPIEEIIISENRISVKSPLKVASSLPFSDSKWELFANGTKHFIKTISATPDGRLFITL